MANYCETTIKCDATKEAKNKFKELIKEKQLFNEGQMEVAEFDCGFFGITNWASDYDAIREIAKEVIAIDSNAVVGVSDWEQDCCVCNAYAFSDSHLEEAKFIHLKEKEIAEKIGLNETEFEGIRAMETEEDEENWYKYFDALQEELGKALKKVMNEKEKQQVLV